MVFDGFFDFGFSLPALHLAFALEGFRSGTFITGTMVGEAKRRNGSGVRLMAKSLLACLARFELILTFENGVLLIDVEVSGFFLVIFRNGVVVVLRVEERYFASSG